MLDVDIQLRRKDFNLCVKFSTSSKLIGVFGKSGAGKSTLINALAGIVKLDSGYIKTDEITLFDKLKGIDIPSHKRRVGYVFQDSLLFPHLSVKANLLYGFKLNEPNDHQISFERIVSLLGVESLLQRRPHTLSGGEKQRVAIGRALLAHPKILLMDEPLASLDLARKVEILNYIECLRDEINVPIVYVSHSITEISRLAEYVVILTDGTCMSCGPLNEVIGQLSFDLADQYAACSIIEASVIEHVEGLTRVSFADGELWLPYLDKEIGKKVRVRIMARDVALSNQPPQEISTLNVLKVRIGSIDKQNNVHANLILKAGRFNLQARLTNRSVRLLDLYQEKDVYALIKTVSFEESL